MNIAYMLGALNRGGTETLLLDVCNNLKDTQIKAILYHRKGGSLEEKFRETSVPMIHLAPKSAAAIIPYLWNFRNSLKQYNIAIVHAQQSLDAVFASLATAGTGIKVIQTFHGYDFKYGIFQKFLLRLSVLLCNASFFVSRTQQDYYLKNYQVFSRRKTDVIYNGIDLKRLRPSNGSNILEEFHVNFDSVKLAMIGNFVPVRDHITVCRFLRQLNEKNVNFTFFFVGAKDPGNPQLYDDCVNYCYEHKLKERVFFTGSRSDVPEILNILDAVIYSSNHDTFGIAVIEAIMAVKTVFVNDLPLFRELFGNRENVIMYRTKDELDLLSKFKPFHKREQKPSVALEQAAQYVSEHFTIMNHIATLVSTYKKLLAKN